MTLNRYSAAVVAVGCLISVAPFVAAQTLRPHGSAFVAGDYHTIGLRADGTVAAWGFDNQGQVSGAAAVRGAVAVSAGGFHSFALHSDGTVSGWGYDEHGETSGAASIGGAAAVAGGAYHSVALNSDGTITAWGRNHVGQLSGIPSPAGAIAVDAGGFHSLALYSDGSVVAWGSDREGQLAGAASIVDAVDVAAGDRHSLALHSDGTVSAWGDNSEGQVSGAGAVTGATAIATNRTHSLALRSNGTVAAWGDDAYGQISGARSLADVVYVTAGLNHDYAVHADGSIVGWGENSKGQLDIPDGFALPTTTRWNEAVSGDYLHSHRWEQRIPSTALSTAHFDREGVYTVSFGNDARAAGLNVSAGDVTFEQNGNSYQVGGTINVTGPSTTLRVDGPVSAANVTNSGLIEIASGGTLTSSSIDNRGEIINNGILTGTVAASGDGMLSGNGIIEGNLTVADGGTLAPGLSVGSMSTSDATFGPDGVFDFEINDANGLAGGPDGWDAIALTGTLAITATVDNPFRIHLRSLDGLATGPAANFDPTQNYSWTFLTAASGISGFDASRFALDASGFSNALEGGSFSISQSGNSLSVDFNSLTAVPEPSSVAMLGMTGLGWSLYRKRRGRRLFPNPKRKRGTESSGESLAYASG